MYSLIGKVVFLVLDLLMMLDRIFRLIVFYLGVQKIKKKESSLKLPLHIVLVLPDEPCESEYFSLKNIISLISEE